MRKNKSERKPASLSLDLKRPDWSGSLTGFFTRENRTKLLLGLLGMVFFILLGRLFYLQVIKGGHYSQMAKDNQILPLPLPAPRGIVKDRNDRTIATDRLSYTVSLIPSEVAEAMPKKWTSVKIKDVNPLVEKIAFCLNSDPLSLKEKISSNWSKAYQPIKLQKDVEFNTICMIEEQNEDLPGVIYQVEPTRKYLEAGWVGHVVGYVNELNKEELSGSSPEKKFRPGGRRDDFSGSYRAR
jgi:penicillin-binding protein 2